MLWGNTTRTPPFGSSDLLSSQTEAGKTTRRSRRGNLQDRPKLQNVTIVTIGRVTTLRPRRRLPLGSSRSFARVDPRRLRHPEGFCGVSDGWNPADDDGVADEQAARSLGTWGLGVQRLETLFPMGATPSYSMNRSSFEAAFLQNKRGQGAKDRSNEHEK